MKPFNNIAVSSSEPKNGADVWIKNCKNLYKGQQIQNGLWVSNDDVGTNVSGWYVIVPITGGEVYTISRKYGKDESSYLVLGVFTTAEYPANGVKKVDTWTTSSDGKKITYQTSSNANYLFIGVAAGNSGQVTVDLQEKALEELQVEKGTEVTEYTKYFKNDILIKDGKEYKSISNVQNVNGINANDVKENGIYAIGVNDNNKNFPFNGGTLLVFFGVVSWGFQLFVPYSISNNGVFVRNYFGSEWSSWKQL